MSALMMDNYVKRSCVTEMLVSNTSLEGYALEEAVNAICDIPSADVWPVVFCRDCIYAPTGEHDGAGLEWPCNDWPDRNPCPFKCEDNYYSQKPMPGFFCANGQRKDVNK